VEGRLTMVNKAESNKRFFRDKLRMSTKGVSDEQIHNYLRRLEKIKARYR
jgi:hypothetical protein